MPSSDVSLTARARSFLGLYASLLVPESPSADSRVVEAAVLLESFVEPALLRHPEPPPEEGPLSLLPHVPRCYHPHRQIDPPLHESSGPSFLCSS